MNKQWEQVLTIKNCEKLIGKETSEPLSKFLQELLVTNQSCQIVIDHIKTDTSIWSNISKLRLLIKMLNLIDKTIKVTQFSIKGKEILEFSLTNL